MRDLARSFLPAAFFLLLFRFPVGEASAQRLDVLIRGGLVIDGTGREPFASDLGIVDGRIAAMEAPGTLSAEGARRTIDASGLVVAPGFIDLHSHAERGLSDPYLAGAANLLAQGITTVVVGQDGSHAWALGGSLGEQVALWRGHGVGTNVIPLAGQGSARFEVMGFGKEPASASERKEIAERVDRFLAEGAWGLSSGLSYEPGRHSPPEEVVEAARPLAKHGGFYISHLRDQGDGLLPSIEETIDLARKTGARVVVSHIKATGKRNWGKSREAVELIRKAREEGLSVYADLYPYETSNDGIDVSLVPPSAVFGAEELRGLVAPSGASPSEVIRWAYRINPHLENRVEPDFLLRSPERGIALALAAGSWLETQPIYRRRVRDVLYHPERSKALLSFVEQLLQAPGGAELFEVTFHPEEKLVGKRLSQIAKEHGASEARIAVELTLQGAKLTQLHLSERDVIGFLQQPFTAGGTDGGIPEYGEGYVHPRSYGTFPRRIHRYVNELQVIELPFAVQTATGLAAEIVGLPDRGLLEKGRWADVIVFDPRRIRDQSTYRNPHRFSEGVEWVLVNGELAVEAGRVNARRAGKVLLKSEREGRGERENPR